jgi:hypothetical protein
MESWIADDRTVAAAAAEGVSVDELLMRFADQAASPTPRSTILHSDPTKAKKTFDAIRAGTIFSDIKLVVGPSRKVFKAHRFVLAGRSQVLRSMLFGSWQESDKPELVVSVSRG